MLKVRLILGLLFLLLCAENASARGHESVQGIDIARSQQAIALAAERLLMLPRAGSYSASSTASAPQGRVPSWSSTVGGIGLDPELVLRRIFGPGKPWVEAVEDGKIDVHWRSSQKRDRVVGRVILGRTTADAACFTPTDKVLARCNALIGRALMAEIATLKREGELYAKLLPKPETWRSPAPIAYHSKRFNIQHTLAARAARAGRVDPLAIALTPVPETHFVLPSPCSTKRRRELKNDWRRWAQIVERWIDPRIHPVQGTSDPAARGRQAYNDVHGAQRQGWVRPISVGWRDRDGSHHLELREHDGRKMAIHRFSPRTQRRAKRH